VGSVIRERRVRIKKMPKRKFPLIPIRARRASRTIYSISKAIFGA
jgi:hypothetical protein